MLIDLNYKNSKEIKERSKFNKMDINSFIEELLENKNKLNYEIYIRNIKINEIENNLEEIKENNMSVAEGTIVDEYYLLEYKKHRLENEITLLNNLLDKLI